MGDFATASKAIFQNPDTAFVGINVVSMDAHKLRAIPLVADAREALRTLQSTLDAGSQPPTSAGYRERIAELKADWDAVVTDQRTVKAGPGDLAQAEVIGIVNDAFGGQATVVCAAGSLPGDLLKLWRTDDPKGYHLDYGYSCMGYEIPGGLGVKLADPEREVVVMVGDGSYLMLNAEIVTAVAEHLRLTIVLVDNHGYQCIVGLQRSVGVPDFGNELRFRDPKRNRLTGPYVPVDFRASAEAMGALALSARTPDELKAAIAQARAADRVSVIVVPVEPEKRLAGFEGWWDVPVAAVSGQVGVQTARREYEMAIGKQRTELK
jgi:3D-(3,5/4)-trihydroxycyclohexane-1,2-dione acylhydrolase (decyclizing)